MPYLESLSSSFSHKNIRLVTNSLIRVGSFSMPRKRGDKLWSFLFFFYSYTSKDDDTLLILKKSLETPVKVPDTIVLNNTLTRVFPCNTTVIRSRPMPHALLVNSLGYSYCVISSRAGYTTGIPVCRHQVPEKGFVITAQIMLWEREWFLKTFSVEGFQWKQWHFLFKKLGIEQDCVCMRACNKLQRIWRSTQRMGQKFKVTKMRNSCYVPFSSRCTQARGLSLLCQWPIDLWDHLFGYKLHTAFTVLLPRSLLYTDNTGFVMD